MALHKSRASKKVLPSMSLTTQPTPGVPLVANPSASRVLVPGSRDLGATLPPFPFNPLLDAPAPRTRGTVIFGLFVFLFFVVGGVGWAVFAPLAEASIAPGVIKVEGSRRTIQHLEGGIVEEILVRDGAKVEQGQVLMRLDDIESSVMVETQRAQRWALMAQDARLNAELSRAREIAFPPELLASIHPRAIDSIAGQRALFEARTASLLSQLQVLEARINQQTAVIQGARGQLASTRRQLTLIKQEEEMTRALVTQGLQRLPQLLSLQRSSAGLDGTIEDLNSQIDRANGSIAESRRQIQQTEEQRMQDNSLEVRDVRGKLAEAEEKLRAAADVMTRREIVAPESGTVVNQRIFTLGAVVKPGDPVMDLVPNHDRLIAEVNVQPYDIDVVYPGLKSEIRLPAFKQRLVPYLHGQVTWVAADVTTNDQTRQQYYRAYVLIDQDQLASLPNVFLTPGMPVEAHVQVGERSFFRYITQPIRDSFHRAFREQ
ncbi:HlyD family type I secretion periplasmic adaptor subunit [Paeniroseomonas aquatica]|uniref:Membrane fusion protein (MFP) family protein n=1 Tax=Paeniroseomonas aquatica TaxID=373043 RepID=A0ABT8A055_9PROT|nr:HlyD family type I secretion periplasmic adaptor subunit [Paeniroseomonas aquatica]MDN3562858.1 HlyD family type I secretion periplasmic adaptor subunit [Paeniroseomonas aquatica]